MSGLTREMLREVHFTDAWPRGFQKFYDEWKKKKDQDDLYVQFTTHMSTDLHRKAHSVPDHSDPEAVYAYPLKYVIDHPGDIWYGHNSSYVRVLQDKSRECLQLHWLRYDEAELLIRKLRLPYNLSAARKAFPEKGKGVTAPGKMFFTCLQVKLDDPIYKPGNRRPDFQLRSSAEQTALLKKLGFDAFKDDAANMKQASINDREPKQIGFLTPQAFKVLSVYRMSDPVRHMPVTTVDKYKLQRKFAAALAAVMGDRIIGDDMFDREFPTKQGRKIVVSTEDVDQNWRMRHLKFGQKKFKGRKKSTEHELTAKITTERGDFTVYWWSDDKLEDAVLSFSTRWGS